MMRIATYSISKKYIFKMPKSMYFQNIFWIIGTYAGDSKIYYIVFLWKVKQKVPKNFVVSYVALGQFYGPMRGPSLPE